MFIVTLSYKKPLNIVDQYLAEHRAYLDACYKENSLVASGPKNPRTGGILLSQLKDRLILESLLKKDPFNIHGIVDYDIIEFEPVKYHPDFKPFLADT